MTRPVRVLHVITRMIVGGAQENTMLSCALIDRERFPSDLLCGEETGPEGELHTESRARGVRLLLEPDLVRDPRPWKDLRVTKRLERVMREGRYDIVHTHTAKAGILGRIAARRARVPIVVHTVHGWSFRHSRGRLEWELYTRSERWCAGWTDAMIVVAEADREEGLRRGIGTAGQYSLIRSGIEIEAYRDVTASRAATRASLGIPLDALVVGTVGRLVRQKAPLDMVAAFRHLAAVREDAHLVFVGEGPLHREVVAAVAAAGLTGRVHLLGLRRDVPALLHAFDVFALASHFEGLPRVFPQAMAAGLPIVATRVDGAPDAIEPGVNGWLVDVGNDREMGERLIQVASDRDAARAMGRAGLERVEEFSASRMVRRLEALYGDLAARRGLS